MARILVVEDHAQQRADLESSLARLGHQVDAVPSGNKALAHLKKHSYGLLVTDLMMKDGTGLDVLYWVTMNLPGMPILVCSGYAQPEVMSSMLKNRPHRIVQKPFRMDDLLQQVKALIGSVEADQEK